MLKSTALTVMPAVPPETVAPINTTAIAIIGMAGQFPKAKTLAQFWDNLVQGKDCISEIPAARWSIDEYYDPDRDKLGKTDCKWMGALDDIDCFDPFFFNISPREAELMDPQQRLFLQACWHCIEDSGYAPARLSGSKCGVFVGCAGNRYEDLIKDKNSGVQMLTGGATSFLASRISYLLNLQGPSIALDTACSSSLVAIANACDSLLLGGSDLALAGGVSVILDPAFYVMGTAAGVFSPDGRCFTFDRRANGFVPSEAVGVVLLKRLADAERDGDAIHGVIRGWGVNHDGKSNGMTAPNAKSQARLLQDIYSRFDINPETIQLVEAHGTGTKLGDPIEIEALTESFRRFTEKRHYCALGSVKSHIGHPLLAAGIAGVIKLLLSLKHRRFVPGLNFESLNEHIELDGSPFYLPDACTDWNVPENEKRRAAISSFGFSGTNAHLVIEEYEDEAAKLSPVAPQGVVLTLSAKTDEALRCYAENLAAYLESRQDVPLLDLAYTYQIGREAMNYRLAVVAAERGELIEKLATYLRGEPCGDCFSAIVNKQKPSISDSDEGREFISKLAQKKSLRQLAELWVGGNAVEWQALYGPRPARLLHGLPAYPFARQRYWACEPAVAAPAAETVRQATRWDGVSYLPRWEEQANSLSDRRTTPPERILLVYDEPSLSLAQAIGESYRQSNSSTVVVYLQLAAGQSARLADDHWLCGVEEAEGFARCLSAYASMACVYFIVVTEDEKPLDSARVLNSRQRHEIQLLRLVKALKANIGNSAFVDCYIVTADNYRLDGGVTNPVGAGLTGLAYSIAQGDHRFLVRNIDLCSDDLAKISPERRLLAGRIADEAASDRGEVIKFMSGRRYRQVFLKLDWATMDNEAAFKTGGVYLILGGAGSVGRVITRCLIEKYQARVIWLGRSPEDSPLVQKKRAAFERLGAPPLYIQADAMRPDSLQQALAIIKQSYPVLNGAMFSGIVFDFENSVAQTTEAAFCDILDVKTLGSINFYEALAAEPLDFLCYFSSGQAYAFSGASTLSAYAAGITFSDSYVQSLQQRSRFPVGSINWGFWQSSLLETPLDYAINALSDADGFACLEGFVGAMRQRYCSQVLCLNASEPVRELMNVNERERAVFTPSGGGILPGPDAARQAGDSVVALIHDPARATLEQWLARLLFVQLREIGAGADVPEQYRRWWDESLAMLERQGYSEELFKAGAAVESNAEAWQAWDRQKPLYLGNPNTQALVGLLDDCLRKLPDILQGRVQATDVLFPESSMEKVAGIYQNNASVDYFNTVLAEQAVAVIRQSLAADPQRRVRILEIGAGTGGTTAMVLRHLRPFAEAVEEYLYTDLSKAFLLHGEAQYGPDFPFLQYKLCNIEQPLTAQGIAVGAYDIVIAANVLHATQDIRRTLRHAKAALRRNGVLLLNEVSDKSLLSHLTFGLLKGWWLYQDENLRIPGSPGLYPETWRQVLAEEGFKTIMFPAQAAHGLGQQIIAAESDGIVRESAGETPVSSENRQRAPDVIATSAPSATGDSRQQIVSLIRDALCRSLKASREHIDNDVPFSDYGIDSILGVGFVKQVNAGLGITMNTAIIFDYSTVNRLAAYILQTFKTLSPPTDPPLSAGSGCAELIPEEAVGQAVKLTATPATDKINEADAFTGLAEKFFSDEISLESLLDNVIGQDAVEWELSDEQRRV